MKPAFVLSLLLIPLVFCSLNAQAQDTPVPVADSSAAVPFRIGGVAALTGPASGWGTKARQGWQLAVDEINRNGGINGRSVELIVEDSKTSGNGSVTALKKLLDVHRIDAAVGDVWDFITTPLLPIIDSRKVPLVSTILSSPVTQRSSYFFTTGPKIESVASAVQQFLALNPEIKRAGLLGFDNDWGYLYEKVWQKSLHDRGGTLLIAERSADLGYDWKASVTKLSPLKLDAVFFSYQADRIVRRLKEHNLKAKLLTTSNIVEELAGRTLPQELSEGIYYTDWHPSAEFSEAFRKKFQEAPMLNAPDAYEAIRSIARAARANPRDLAAGMRTVHYDGVTGPVDFRESNAGNQSTASLFVVRNGVGTRVQ